MKVSELISILEKMPQDARVIITECQRGNWDNEVRDVIYNDPARTKDSEDAGCVELDNWPKEIF